MISLWEIFKLVSLSLAALVLFGVFIWLITYPFVLSLVVGGLIIMAIVVIYNANQRKLKCPKYITCGLSMAPLKLPDNVRMIQERNEENIINVACQIENQIDIGEVIDDNHVRKLDEIKVMNEKEIKSSGRTRTFWRKPTVEFRVGAIQTIKH